MFAPPIGTEYPAFTFEHFVYFSTMSNHFFELRKLKNISLTI